MSRSATTLCALTLLSLLSFGPGCRLTQRDTVVDQLIDRDAESGGLRILEKIPGADLFGIAPPLEDSQKLGLYAVTPFDQSKIPVVLIHGLVSDPNTWAEMLEQLSEEPEIVRNYQFWTFLYRPENSLLKSASDLRGSLQDAMLQLDPKSEHARLSNMVLIGHSIGGLLAKFQVTHSERRLWDAVSDQPIESQTVDSALRSAIQDAFIFEPQPMVRKVIYIGVPHIDTVQGKDGSRRLGHRLFELPASLRQGYRKLVEGDESPLIDDEMGIQIEDNPLVAESPILKATNELRLGNEVTIHSIIGNGGSSAEGLPGDGLVSVASAKFKDSESNWYVSAPRAELHRADDSIREVKRILLQHLKDTLPQSDSPIEPNP